MGWGFGDFFRGLAFRVWRCGGWGLGVEGSEV